MTVRAVVLDMGMTVLRAEPSYIDVFVEGCAGAGLDVRDRAPGAESGGFAGFGDVWRQHSDVWDETGRPSPHSGDPDAERDFWTGLYVRLLELLEVEVDRPKVATAVYQHFQRPTSFAPYPDALDAIDDLRDRGVKLAVCSNWGPALRELLEHHDLVARFDAVAISGELGAVKPDPEIFEAVLRELDEEPGPHVAHVGDDLLQDVAPARELGLQAVLMDRYDRHPDHDGPRIRTLAELPEVLGLPEPQETVRAR